MKKQLVLLGALLCSTLMAQKIAVVDIDVVLEHHPNTKGDRATLELTLEEYATERDALLEDIKKRETELETIAKQLQNPMLAQAKLDELQKKGESLFAELNQVKQNAELQVAKRRKDLQELEARLVRRSTKDVIEKVDAYAKEKGYDLILDKRNVPFVTKAYEVTDEIIVRCGGTIPAATAAAEAPALEQPAKVSTKDEE